MDNHIYSEVNKKIKDLIFHFEVNQIICRSNSVGNTKATYSSIEHKIETKKDYKIKVNQVFLLSHTIVDYGNETKDWKDSETLKGLWLNNKVNLFLEIDEMASKGENKYELNSYFLSLFDMLDKKIRSCNFHTWVAEMDPANNKERMLLGIGKMFMPLNFVYFNLDMVLQIIHAEFAFRYYILNDIKFELVKLYSKHLLLPPINQLPKTPFIGKNKTEMYELIVMMENYADIQDFEKLKSFLLIMLGLDVKKYKDFKSEILERKIRYGFLKKVLISSKDIDKDC